MTGPADAPAFPRRPLGFSEVLVTSLGFGSAPLGEHKVRVSETDAEATLMSAYAAGVRYFDTAPFYGYGLAEHRTGRALRALPGDCVISTKVGRWLRPRDPGDVTPRVFKGGLSFDPVLDYSHAGTMRSVEQSLARLGLPRIDVALIHDADIWTHGADGFPGRLDEAMAGAFPALQQLRSEGIIRAIGLGLNDVTSALAFLDRGDFDCLMLAGRYTLLNQEGLVDLLPLCQRRGISVLVAAPFNSGILATGARPGAYYDYRPASAEILDKVQRIERACMEHDVPLAAAALQFPLGHPAVASVVAGAVSAAEMERNGSLMRRAIPVELWEELRRQHLLPATAPVPGEQGTGGLVVI